MKRFAFRSIFIFSALVCLFSCKSEYEALLKSNDVNLKYKAAMDYYEKGKYNRAADLFESLSMLTSGLSIDDTVQFYWGKSNYNYRDFYTAETNFQKFLEVYPTSPFASEATFLRLECLYKQTLRYELDQAPTHKAMAAIDEYISDYAPDSTARARCKEMKEDLQWRLDTKAYEAARLYYNMEDYIASKVAFRNILKDNAENIYREDILYYIAMSSYKYARLSVPEKQKERYIAFQDDYLNFLGEYPQSSYRRELDLMHRRSQKALGRYVGETEDDTMSERDFVKDRKFKERQEAIKSKGASATQKNDAAK
jgi:outer membrane protein assembly factor BamD